MPYHQRITMATCSPGWTCTFSVSLGLMVHRQLWAWRQDRLFPALLADDSQGEEPGAAQSRKGWRGLGVAIWAGSSLEVHPNWPAEQCASLRASVSPFCKIEMNPAPSDISNALGSTDGKENWFTSLPLLLWMGLILYELKALQFLLPKEAQTSQVLRVCLCQQRLSHADALSFWLALRGHESAAMLLEGGKQEEVAKTKEREVCPWTPLKLEGGAGSCSVQAGDRASWGEGAAQTLAEDKVSHLTRGKVMNS